MLRRAFDWTFRSREDGRIVLAQFPNLPLGLFIAAAALRWALDPAGDAGRVLDAVATASLVWWAALELWSGVNPFRRALGGVVLVSTALRLLGS